jgi:hypothetical protein
MKKQANILAIALMLSASMILGGCKSAPPAATPAATAGTTNPDGSITNPDGSVTYPAGSKQAQTAAGKTNPDGSVTNPDGSVTYPAGTKAAAAEPPPPAVAPAAAAPASQASAPPPPPPAPKVVTVPRDTRVAVSITETLSAKRNSVGDGFSGTLAEPIRADGTTVFARGTRVTGTVVASKGQGRFKGAGDLGIELSTIAGMRVSSTEYEKAQSGKGKRTAGFIGGGGGAGALIGGLAGGGKGALIGGLLGAGAGTAGAAYTGNKDVVIPSETVVTFRLTSPLSVTQK